MGECHIKGAIPCMFIVLLLLSHHHSPFHHRAGLLDSPLLVAAFTVLAVLLWQVCFFQVIVQRGHRAPVVVLLQCVVWMACMRGAVLPIVRWLQNTRPRDRNALRNEHVYAGAAGSGLRKVVSRELEILK